MILGEKMFHKTKLEQSIDKRLINACLDYLILLQLSKEPTHGYGLIKIFRTRFNIYLGPSTVYPILDALEKQNLIRRRYVIINERAKKVCEITEKGREKLERMRSALKSMSLREEMSVLVSPLIRIEG